MKALALNSVVIPDFQTDVFFQPGGTTDSRLLDVSQPGPGMSHASGVAFNHHFPSQSPGATPRHCVNLHTETVRIVCVIYHALTYIYPIV